MTRRHKLRMGTFSVAFMLVGGLSVTAVAAPPAPAPAGSTLEQRIAQRKAEQGTALSEKDTQRLTGTCTAAQSKLRLQQSDEVTLLENRAAVYGSIDAQLWITIGQLKLASQDTFQLEKQRQTLADKTADFQARTTDYLQALDDSLLINCKADPGGFKALLDTARLYQDQLRAQSADSRNYIINTVKNSLASHTADLRTKPVPAGRGN